MIFLRHIAFLDAYVSVKEASSQFHSLSGYYMGDWDTKVNREDLMGNINFNITHVQLFTPYAMKVDTDLWVANIFSTMSVGHAIQGGKNEVYKALGTVRF